MVVDATIKNIEKILKKRKDTPGSIIFIDNELYSYINHLDKMVPVPKFIEERNASLFYLKFLLSEKLDEHKNLAVKFLQCAQEKIKQ
jgi:TFIIF-interacting CTD phosphatase-like protein